MVQVVSGGRLPSVSAAIAHCRITLAHVSAAMVMSISNLLCLLEAPRVGNGYQARLVAAIAACAMFARCIADLVPAHAHVRAATDAVPASAGRYETRGRQATGASGASPPVRGGSRPVRPTDARSGCTPAFAGKPTTGSAATACGGVHPRACGAFPVPVWHTVGSKGASPRARGVPRKSR